MSKAIVVRPIRTTSNSQADWQRKHDLRIGPQLK